MALTQDELVAAFASSTPDAPKPVAAPSAPGLSIDPQLDALANEYGVPSEIVHSILGTEATPDGRTSPKGAKSRMQVMPGTVKQYLGIDPGTANDADYARAGVMKLADDYSHYNGDPKLTAAAYFAGRGDKAKGNGALAYAAGNGHTIGDGNLNINQYVDRFSEKLKKYGQIGRDLRRSAPGETDAYAPPTDGTLASPLDVKRDESSPMAHGAKDAIQQVPQLLYGTAAYLGDAFGSEWLKNNGLELYKKKSAEMAETAQPYQDIQDAWHDDAMGKWFGYAMGYSGVQLVQALGTGGIGAMAGKIGLKSLLEATATRAGQEAIASGVAARAAAQLGITEAAAASKIGQQAAELAGAKFGGAVAMGANSEAMEIGQIYPDAVEEAAKTGKPVDLTRVGLSSTLAASLDVLPEMRIGNKLLGSGEKVLKDAAYAKALKASERGMVSRVGAEIPKQMLFEGTTEGAQTPIEHYGAGKDPFSADAIKDTINSAAMGAVGGGFGGLLAGLPKPPTPIKPVGIPGSPLTSAANAGHNQAAAPAPSQFGTPELDKMHSDVAAFMADPANLAALKVQDPTMPDQAAQVWAYINNPAVQPGLRAQALQQAHALLTNLPNFTQGRAPTPPRQITDATGGMPEGFAGSGTATPPPALPGTNAAGASWADTNPEMRDMSAAMESGSLSPAAPVVAPPPAAAMPTQSRQDRLNEIKTKVEQGWTPGTGLTMTSPAGETVAVTAAEKAVALKAAKPVSADVETAPEISGKATAIPEELDAFEQSFHPDPLQRPGALQKLESMAAESGWDTQGGRMIREYSEHGADSGAVVGRTPWIAKADWWAGKPAEVTESGIKSALQKFKDGAKLTPKDSRTLNFLLQAHHDKQVAESLLTAAELSESGYNELTATEQADFDAIIRSATEAGIDVEAIQERTAIQLGDAPSQREYTYAVREAIHEELDRQANSQAAEQPDAGEQGASGAGRSESAGDDRSEEDFALEQQTAAGLTQQAAAQAAANEAADKAAQAAEDTARKARIQKEIDSRQQGSAENFQLGQSAEDGLAGQGGLFDQPAEPRSQVHQLALDEQKKAGWNSAWPFVPADLLNADFRELLSKDPSLSDAEKASIFAAGMKLGVVPAATQEPEESGASPEETAEIAAIFDDYESQSPDDGDGEITHVFDAPKKTDIVRLQNKVKVYHDQHGWMTPAEARAVVDGWKAHALAQGDNETSRNANGQKVVLSLFDLTGKWSQPWVDAGYNVFRFDIQDDAEMGDVHNFSTGFFNDWFGDFDGMDVHAVLAACPCTDFAVSGARHFAAKDADGRTISSVDLVHKTLQTIEYFKPSVWAIENPVGRIEKLTGLPPWRLSFDPNHLGEPYTKKTLLWGRFNGDLPIAPVEATEGSKMWSQYGGKSQATKNARSATPEGFSYGFFMANNAIDHPAMAVANKYDRLDKNVIERAMKRGVTEAQISAAIDDFYYMDLDDKAAEKAIRGLIGDSTPPAPQPPQQPLDMAAISTSKPADFDKLKAAARAIMDGNRTSKTLPAVAQQMYVEFGGQRFPVESLRDASEKWEKFRDETGAGSSEIDNLRILDQTGKQVAYVSYNGRVWPGSDYNPNAESLYDPVSSPREIDSGFGPVIDLMQQAALVDSGLTSTDVDVNETPNGDTQAADPSWIHDEIVKLIHLKGRTQNRRVIDKAVELLKRRMAGEDIKHGKIKSLLPSFSKEPVIKELLSAVQARLEVEDKAATSEKRKQTNQAKKDTANGTEAPEAQQAEAQEPQAPDSGAVEPWQMDHSEFAKQKNGNPHWDEDIRGGDGEYLRRAQATHKRLIEAALQEGKMVPADVLADYPELEKKKVGAGDTARAPAVKSANKVAGSSFFSKPNTALADAMGGAGIETFDYDVIFVSGRFERVRAKSRAQAVEFAAAEIKRGASQAAKPIDEGPHFAAGEKDFAEGKPRLLPSYFTMPKGKNAQDWYRGWDSANAAAPVNESAPAAQEEPATEATPEADKAKQDFDDALGELGDLFGAKINLFIVTPEQEQKLFPILTKLFDAAFRMGYHKFKKAARFVLDTIRTKAGDGIADQISLDHLQGAYIGMAARYKEQGADTKRDVVNVDSIEDLYAPDPAGVDAAAHEAAPSPKNDKPEPTEGQIKAGNYPKGHINVRGLEISIENPQGSVRSGTDANGKAWSQTLHSHYGYILGTVGKDKDHIDIFVKLGTPEDFAGPVFVIDQRKKIGTGLDEHKVMLGYVNAEEARNAYLANYDKGWNGLMNMTETTMPMFKDWLEHGNHQEAAYGWFAKNYGKGDERAKDAKGNPIFEAGDRVQYISGGWAGRHGTVSKHDAITMQSVMLFSGKPPVQGETSHYYRVVTDNGAELYASSGEIGIETARPADVVPDIFVEDHHNTPDSVWRGYVNAKSSAQNQRAAADRARKPESIAEHRKSAQASDAKAAQHLAAWEAWAAQHPDAAKAESDGEWGVAKTAAIVPNSGTIVPNSGTKLTGPTETKHTKTGAAIFMVKIAGRVERPEYERLNSLAKRNGGIYSKFTRAFNFKSKEAAEQFMGSDKPVAISAPSTTLGVKETPNDQSNDLGSRPQGTEPRNDQGSGSAGRGSLSNPRPLGAGVEKPDTGTPALGRPFAAPATTSGAGTGSGASNGTGGRVQLDGSDGVRENPGHQPGTVIPKSNFTITDESGIGEGGLKQKYSQNVAAINLLARIEDEDRYATPDEQAILARYVGWGGLKSVFDDANKQWGKEFDEIKGLLTPKEYAAARASVLDAHYTSVPVVRAMWSAVKQLGFTGGKVLEPSVGVGNFFGLMPGDIRAQSSLSGVELDDVTGRIAKQLYQTAAIASPVGFEAMVVAPESVDLVIGNPPFGQQSIYDSANKDISKFSLHNFFFAKGLKSLHPGGLQVMVVSRYLMDSVDSAARSWMADHAKLIGAVRLPYTAFKGNANTEVVTDIIVLQKLAEGEKADTSWINTGPLDVGGEPATINQYFIDHPEHVLGQFATTGSQYRANELTVEPVAGETIEAGLERVFATFPENIYQRGQTAPHIEALNAIEGHVPESVEIGGLFLLPNGDIGQRLQDGSSTDDYGNFVKRHHVLQGLTDTGKDRIKGMIAVRDALLEQFRAELSNSPSIEQERAGLNHVYDSFVKKFGYINSTSNRRAFQDDPRLPLMESLEPDYSPGISKLVAKKRDIAPVAPSAGKAAIFAKRVLSPYQQIESASNAKDAMVASLSEHGYVNLDYMARIYGKDQEDIVAELGDLLYQDPDTTAWQTADEYLSGNVKAKLAQAKHLAEQDPAYFRNIEALEKVIPKDVPANQIGVRLGSHWVPAADINAFAKSLIGANAAVHTQYMAPVARWKFDYDGGAEMLATTNRWGTNRVPFDKLMNAVMNNQAIVVKDNHGDSEHPNWVVNEAETQMAQTKAMEINKSFKDWIFADIDRRTRLEKLYNDLMNTSIDRHYDGSHVILPGASPFIAPRKHQLDGIWRGIQDRNVLLDHVVGAGKTILMTAMAMEFRRLGIARKPMFAVPNHLVRQWRDEFYKLYPNANILVATENDFDKKNRQRLFGRIATGDWDAVIIAHSSFKKIGAPKAMEQEILGEMLDDITNAIEDMKRERGDRQVMKDMERIKKNLEAKMKKLNDMAGQKDAVATLDELGVDAMFTDEMHIFKNLNYYTQMKGVAGLGDPSGSGRAFDMFVKSRWLQKQFGGKAPFVTATGTPVSNSLVEMYTMMRYHMYDDMRARGIHLLDPWANTFGDVKQVYEVHPSGNGYRLANRFAEFVNLGEMMSLYRGFADIITLDDLKKQAADAGERFPVPRLKGGKPDLRVAPRSEDQTRFFGVPEFQRDDTGAILFELPSSPETYTTAQDKEGKWQIVMAGNTEQTANYKTYDDQETADAEMKRMLVTPQVQYNENSILWKFENLKQLNKDTKGKINALSITNEARKAGLDYRLIDPSAADYPQSKLNDAVAQALRIYHQWHADKGTQLIFCDLSVPKSAVESLEGPVFYRMDGELTEGIGRAALLDGAPDWAQMTLVKIKGRTKADSGYAMYEAHTGVRLGGGPTKASATESAKNGLRHAMGRLEAAYERMGAITEDEIQELKDRKAEETDASEEDEDAISMDQLMALNTAAKFSVYDDIKAKLIAAGIPENEIAFIHDFNTALRKQAAFELVRTGAIRILLGSTEKMGAGMNVQDRLVAIHHLDAPWRPSDLEQRNGRIMRQGNKLYKRDPDGFEVEELRYASKQTYDTRMWQIQENKAKGVEQLRAATAEDRTIKDIAGDAANAADMKAAASGNPLILDEIRLRNEMQSLENQQQGFNNANWDLQNKERWLVGADARRDTALDDLKPLEDVRDAYPKEPFSATFGDQVVTDKAEIATPIMTALKKSVETYALTPIGMYRGVHLFAKSTPGTKKEDGTLYVYASLNPNKTNFQAFDAIAYYGKDDKFSASGLLQRVDNKLDGVAGMKQRALDQYQKEQVQLVAVREALKETWPKSAELSQKRADHLNVVRKLQSQGGAIELTPAMRQELETAKRARMGAAYVPPMMESRGTVSGDGTPASIRSAFVKAFGEKTVRQLEANGLATIVATADDLPFAVSATAKAVFLGGKAYFIADRMNEATAQREMLHEIGEHYGLEKLLGADGYQNLTRRITELAQAGDERAAAAWAFVKDKYPNLEEGENLFMHEVLAQLGQDAKVVQQSWFQDLVAAFKRFLVKLGFTGMIKVADLQDMVLHSLKTAAYTDGGPRGGIRNSQIENGVMASTAVKLADDLADQEHWLTAQAKQRGYDDLDSFVADDYPAFETVASQWREQHPAEMMYAKGMGAKAVDIASAAFKAWFGDSKVVDADGKPLRVYHGTTRIFTSFESGKLGEKTGAADAREGFFFSENPDSADQFTWENGEKSGSLMPVHLRISNPAYISDLLLDGSKGTEAGKRIAEAKAAGHDGIVFENSDMLGHKGRVFVAFRPEQIKSAISNTGEFSTVNPNIMESRAEREQGIPPGASNILSSSKYETEIHKGNPDYDAAKQGDIEAARRFILAQVANSTISYAKHTFGKEAIYVAPHAEEASGRNAIPIALANYYAHKTGAHLDTEILQTVRAQHTNAPMMERLLRRAEFDGKVLANRKYVLVDDVVTGGGTLAELADYIRMRGGIVLGIVTIANASQTPTMRVSHDTLQSLQAKFGDFIRRVFHVRPEALTAPEAEFLDRFPSLDALRDRLAATGQEGKDRLASEALALQDGVTPQESRGSYLDRFADIGGEEVVDRLKQKLTDTFNTKRTFNSWWHKGPGTQYHKAEIDPQHFGPVFKLAQKYIDDTARYANMAADMAPGLIPNVDTVGDAFRGIKNMQADAADAQAMAKAVFAGTLDDRVFSDAELREQFSLNEKQIGLYHQFRAAVNTSLDNIAISEMNRLAKTSDFDLAPTDLSMRETAEFYQEQYQDDLDAALEAMAELVAAHAYEKQALETASEDKAGDEGSAKQYGKLIAGMTQRHAKEMQRAKDALANMTELHSGFIGKAQKIEGLQANGYAPLMRFGRYTVDVFTMGEDGKPAKDENGDELRHFFGMFEDEAQANAATRALAEEFPDAEIKQGILSEKASQLFQGVTPETLEIFGRTLDADMSDAFQAYLKLATNNRSAMKRLIERKKIAGYADDAVRTLASFITSNARMASANNNFGDMLKAAAAIPKEKGDVKDEAVNLLQYVQNPGEEASKLRGLLFVNYLGGSVASALVNMTQPILMTFPYLHQFSPKAGSILASTMGLASKHMFGKDVQIADDDLREAMQRAAEEGITNPQEIHMLQGEAGRSGLFQNNRAIRNVTKVWGSFFSLAESFNRYSTFMAAFRIAQDMGLDGLERAYQDAAAIAERRGLQAPSRDAFNDPYEFAKKAVYDTQGIYSKANRPNWGRGAIGATLMTFKQFSIAYIEFLKRLPAKERALALAILMLAAGVQGMPGADDLDDLIDTIAQSLGFSFNTKQEKRDFIAKVLGKDAAGFITYGVSYGLPIDVAGRMSAGNLLPGTGIFKKSEKDKSRDVMEFFGAAGGLAQNVMHGIEAGQSGDAGGVVTSMLPKALGDAYKAYDMAMSGKYHDTKGRVVTDASPLDVAIKGIGFQPAHIAADTRERSLVMQNVALLRATQHDITSAWAQGVFERDPAKVAEAKGRMAEWNRDNPGEAISVKYSTVQKLVHQMNLTSNQRFVNSSPKQMKRDIAASLND